MTEVLATENAFRFILYEIDRLDRILILGADEWSAISRLLREVLGNPFRQVAVPSSWRNSDIVHIARSIYDDRAFDHLPVLADALEEAGCDDANLLAHCRRPGEHVRGCWAVDRILGKE